jgi:hypothetical protein
MQTSDRKIECNPPGTLVGKLTTPTGLYAIVLASIITISEHLHNTNFYILELFIQPKALLMLHLVINPCTLYSYIIS